MASDSEPRLPSEIERHIFEMAPPKDHKAIVLVARRVHEWIFPLQFHSLVFNLIQEDPKHLEKFLDLMQTKPSGYFTPHVNKLLLRSDDSVESAPKLLAAFSSLKWLAIWSDEADPQFFELIFGLVELKRLSLSGGAGVFFEAMRKKPESEPVLPNLTHFDVEFGNMDRYPDPICINRLQSLTHLCYSCDGEIPDDSLNLNVQLVLNGSSVLRMLVLLDLSSALLEEDKPTFGSDLRVVLVEESFVGPWVWDWNAHERGQHDFWDRVEFILASKRLQIS